MSDPASRTQSPYGSKAARLGGYLIDGGLIYACQFAGSFFGGVLAALMTGSEAPPQVSEDAAANGILLGWIFWGCVTWFLNYGILQGMAGGSIGKLALGLKVVNLDGSPLGIWKSLGRSLCYMVSAMPFYVGFLSIIWSKTSQCWHDLICDTVVIRKDAAFPVAVAALELHPEQQKESAISNAA